VTLVTRIPWSWYQSNNLVPLQDYKTILTLMPCINIIVAFAGEPLGEKKGFKKDLHQCEKDIIEP